MIYALDTETSGLHPDDGAQVLVLAWAWRDVDQRLQARAIPSPFAANPDWPSCDIEEWRQVASVMGAPQQHLIFHNSKFDLLHMERALRGDIQSHQGKLRPVYRAWEENTFWDTMLAQKIIDGENSAALKTTAARLWPNSRATRAADELEEWFVQHRQKTRPRYGEVPWDLVARYARQDVRLTYRLWEWQVRILEEEFGASTRGLIRRELEFVKVLLRMEQRGIGFDVATCVESREWLEGELRNVASHLPFRTTLPAAKAFFFGHGTTEWVRNGRVRRIRHLGLRPLSLTKSGAPALSERDVSALAKAGHPYAATFHRHEALKSMIAKWYAPWPKLVGLDGRLRPAFNPTRVRSHRLSVERVQVQAIPHIRHFRDMGLPDDVALPRQLFIPRPRHRLWEVDLSQGEVRIATAVTGCKAMRRIIESADVHGETCKEIFGIDESSPVWSSQRDMAKRLTFGTIYGAGAKKLAETAYLDTGIEIPVAMMQRLVDRYKETFPEFFVYAREQERFCQHNGFIVLVSGKRRYFRFGAPLWEKAHTAFNGVIQGGLAETMRDVMITVEKALPGCLLLQIHDSLVLEIPKNPAPGATDADWAETCRQIMINTYTQQYGVPFDAKAARWEDKD